MCVPRKKKKKRFFSKESETDMKQLAKSCDYNEDFFNGPSSLFGQEFRSPDVVHAIVANFRILSTSCPDLRPLTTGGEEAPCALSRRLMIFLLYWDSEKKCSWPALQTVKVNFLRMEYNPGGCILSLNWSAFTSTLTRSDTAALSSSRLWQAPAFI